MIVPSTGIHQHHQWCCLHLSQHYNQTNPEGYLPCHQRMQTTRPLLTREKPAMRDVRMWPEGLFNSTESSVFRQAATNNNQIDVDENAASVSKLYTVVHEGGHSNQDNHFSGQPETLNDQGSCKKTRQERIWTEESEQLNVTTVR